MNEVLIHLLSFALLGSASMLIFLCINRIAQYFLPQNTSIHGEEQ